jgi:hypothetical protein
MDPVTLGLLIGGSALANLGGSFFGASAQTKAAQAATQAQLQMFQAIAGRMDPYINFGKDWGIPGYQQATGTFEQAIPGLSAPLTAADVAATPGFQFMLDQGLKSTQAGFAAQGLGSSGAAIKGAGQYETGLASTTIPTWLDQILRQRMQGYNMLQGAISPFAGAVNTGVTAGQALGGFGTTTAGNIGQNIVGAGNAQAAAAMSAAGTVGQIPNQYMQYSLLNQLIGGRGTAVPGVPAVASSPFGPNPLAPGAGAAGQTAGAVPFLGGSSLWGGLPQGGAV